MFSPSLPLRASRASRTCSMNHSLIVDIHALDMPPRSLPVFSLPSALHVHVQFRRMCMLASGRRRCAMNLWLWLWQGVWWRSSLTLALVY